MSLSTLVSSGSLQSSEAAGNDWTRRTGLTKAQAEELLDWLEVNGYGCRVVCLTKTGFEVHFQEPSRVLRAHEPNAEWAGLHYVLDVLLKPFQGTASR